MILALQSLQLSAPNLRERTTVATFLREAHIGVEGIVLPTFAKLGAPRLSVDQFLQWVVRRYDFGKASLEYSPLLDRVIAYSEVSEGNFSWPYEPDGTVRPRRVSNEEAAIIAQRLYQAAGNPGEIRVEEVTDLMGGNDTCVGVRYVPTIGGVPYGREYERQMEIDRQTGEIQTFSSLTDLPLPPPSLRPVGSLDEARLLAMRAALARGRARGLRTVRADRRDFELRVWLPPAGYARDDLARFGIDPRLRNAIAARRGLLAYVGRVEYRPGLWADMVVEARTGEVLRLEVQDLVQIMKGAGGGAPPPMTRPLALPTGARPWRTATAGKGWKGWSAVAIAAMTPAKAVGPLPKGRLTLSDGESAYRVAYDAGRDLVLLPRPEETPLAYRPGAALSRLLRRTARASRPEEGDQSFGALQR